MKFYTLAVFHGILFTLHISQCIAQFALAATKPPIFVPITVNLFSGGPPWGNQSVVVTEVETLLNAQVMYLPATFLLLTAIAHLITATCYRTNMIWTFSDPPEAAEGRIKAYVLRWTEYSVSATIMIVGICLISGINNLYALLASAFCNFAMILFGHFSDEFRFIDTNSSNVWMAWFVGAIVGLAPWINIVTSIVVFGIDLSTEVGRLIIGMTSVTASFFFSFAAVSFYYSIYASPAMCKCTRKRKRQSSKTIPTVTSAETKKETSSGDGEVTTYEEVWYPVLSTISKTMLAWLVFAALYQSAE